jgi:hypothetical protein
LILEAEGFWISEEQYEVVCAAAGSLGETSLYFSVVRGYRGGPAGLQYYTWELPLHDYEGYCDADCVGFPTGSGIEVPQEFDLGIPLDRALYSSRGEWGVLMPDVIALVGGSSRFMGRFKQHHPNYNEDLAAFLDRFRAASKRAGQPNDSAKRTASVDRLRAAATRMADPESAAAAIDSFIERLSVPPNFDWVQALLDHVYGEGAVKFTID